MSRLSLILAAFVVTSAYLSAAEAPLALPKAAQLHLPAGWKVLKAAQGDLNADGLADLVFVREETDPKKITKRDDGFAQNGNPRTVIGLMGFCSQQA